MTASSETPAVLDSGASLRRERIVKSAGETALLFTLFLKRCFDLLGAVVLLCMGVPLFLLISLAIRCTSPGPVFFRQKRVGMHGKPFTIYKFRTMVAGNSGEDHKQYIRYLLTEGIDAENKSDFIEKYVSHVEEKITSVGRILRASSLDELPQLFNIFLGHMSFVGPRPHPEYEVAEYKTWYRRRHEMKPGLTGWSKLNLRLTPKNYEESMMYDIWYVDHWTLWLDLKIIALTVPFVLSRDGAH